MQLRTLIVDDEAHATESLRIILHENCPTVSIVATFNDSTAALEFLQHNSIDLLLLDIDMPLLNGFELLSRLNNIAFRVIFVTAYDQFALRAFRFSAFDYLLKPVDETLLVESIRKLAQYQSPFTPAQLRHLLSIIKPSQSGIQRVAFSTAEGIEFVELVHIVRCEADSNYTKIFLQNAPMLMVSRTLKEIEEMFEGLPFLRTHHSHLVAKNHIKKYIKTDGGYLLMTDKAQVPISRARKDDVLAWLTQ